MDVATLEPEEILDRRLIKKDNAAYLQVLIKWSSMPPSMATWEDYDVLRQRFPGAAAWGQAATQGDGGVTLGMPREELELPDATTTTTSPEEESGE